MQALAMTRNWYQTFALLGIALAVIWPAGHHVRVKLATTHISVPEAIAMIDSGALVIDVRTAPATHLPGAMLIPLQALEARLASLEVAKTQPIVVYCGNGSSLGPEAAHRLSQAGFTRVVNLQPGIEGWRGAGLPVAAG